MDKFIKLFFESGEVTGLGLIAVIAIIAIIFAVIKMLGSGLSTGKKSAKKAEPAPAPVAEPVAEPVPAAQDDSELIAVLAAAVSAYCGEPVTKFRVVSFKHIK